MNGAESLVRTLVDSGVDLCITNPGTSEMHFVAALDKLQGMRCVLGLFEGVVTGAADGYYRMAERPAATLLHLGPGLANGLANLHNAKKARSGIVNIVGEHATYHLAHDAPLTSDVAGVARPMSDWVHTSASVARRGPRRRRGGAGGAHAAGPHRHADPAGRHRLERGRCAGRGPGRSRRVRPVRRPMQCRPRRPRCAAAARSALLLGGVGVREPALQLAGRIAARTGCALLSEFNSARLERGAGRVVTQRIPYVVDSALALLKDFSAHRAGGCQAAGGLLRLPGQAQPAGAAGLRVQHAGHGGGRHRRRLAGAWPTNWMRRRWRRPMWPRWSGRRCRRARSRWTAWPRCWARCCRRRPSSSTRRCPPAAASAA